MTFIIPSVALITGYKKCFKSAGGICFWMSIYADVTSNTGWKSWVGEV